MASRLALLVFYEKWILGKKKEIWGKRDFRLFSFNLNLARAVALRSICRVEKFNMASCNLSMHLKDRE